jgi:hypothetical protein
MALKVLPLAIPRRQLRKRAALFTIFATSVREFLDGAFCIAHL